MEDGDIAGPLEIVINVSDVLSVDWTRDAAIVSVGLTKQKYLVTPWHNDRGNDSYRFVLYSRFALEIMSCWISSGEAS